MPGAASITATITAALQGFSLAFSAGGSLAIAGNKRSDLIQDIDSTGEALSIGSCASVGAFAAFVMTGTAAATVTFYRDSGFTQAISSAVPQSQLGVLLVNPPTIYAKASSGTIQVRVFAVEQ